MRRSSVELQHLRLQIGALRKERVHWVVSRRAGGAQDTAGAACIAEATAYQIGEGRRVDMVRAMRFAR